MPRLDHALVCTPGQLPDAPPPDAVLVVDQFEEIFTLCREHEARAAFVDRLVHAPNRVVIGVRADFFAHCTAFPALVEQLRDGQLTVGPMSTTELRQAVTLREIEGLSYEEIAEVMNCPIGTVRSRIFRAREAISARVKPLLDSQSGKRW